MIGVLGGTFNPIHFGHLRPALELYEELELTQLRWVPCGVPPHRERPAVSAELRLAMVRAAVDGQPGFVVDDREVRRPGPSYMVDTLRSLRAELGDTPMCLIIGMDAFAGLDTWHRWRELTELAHLVVTHRPGWHWDGGPQGASAAVRSLWAACGVTQAHALHGAPAGKIVLRPVTPLDISSTRIRAAVAAGRSPRYLLPDAVWRLIEEHKLYRL